MKRTKEDEVVRLNIFALVMDICAELWIEQLKANLQADLERKRIKPHRFSMSWSGPEEIPLSKKQADVLASALVETLRKAFRDVLMGRCVEGELRDEGRQWCLEVNAHFWLLDKDPPELAFARNLKDSPELASACNLVEGELNGTIEVYPGTVRIRFPHYQPPSLFSSLLALWKRR